MTVTPVSARRQSGRQQARALGAAHHLCSGGHPVTPHGFPPGCRDWRDQRCRRFVLAAALTGTVRVLSDWPARPPADLSRRPCVAGPPGVAAAVGCSLSAVAGRPAGPATRDAGDPRAAARRLAVTRAVVLWTGWLPAAASAAVAVPAAPARPGGAAAAICRAASFSCCCRNRSRGFRRETKRFHAFALAV